MPLGDGADDDGPAVGTGVVVGSGFGVGVVSSGLEDVDVLGSGLRLARNLRPASRPSPRFWIGLCGISPGISLAHLGDRCAFATGQRMTGDQLKSGERCSGNAERQQGARRGPLPGDSRTSWEQRSGPSSGSGVLGSRIGRDGIRAIRDHFDCPRIPELHRPLHTVRTLACVCRSEAV